MVGSLTDFCGWRHTGGGRAEQPHLLVCRMQGATHPKPLAVQRGKGKIPAMRGRGGGVRPRLGWGGQGPGTSGKWPLAATSAVYVPCRIMGWTPWSAGRSANLCVRRVPENNPRRGRSSLLAFTPCDSPSSSCPANWPWRPPSNALFRPASQGPFLCRLCSLPHFMRHTFPPFLLPPYCMPRTSILVVFGGL
jgi:hypothetical protein